MTTMTVVLPADTLEQILRNIQNRDVIKNNYNYSQVHLFQSQP
jgi:hypothetical protein